MAFSSELDLLWKGREERERDRGGGKEGMRVGGKKGGRGEGKRKGRRKKGREEGENIISGRVKDKLLLWLLTA